MSPEEWKIGDLFIDREQQFNYKAGEPAEVYAITREFDDKEGWFRVVRIGKLTMDGKFTFDLDIDVYLNGGELWWAHGGMEIIELESGVVKSFNSMDV